MTENEIAIMESEMILANYEYFAARPELDTPQSRKVYGDAFKRAWRPQKPEKKILRRGDIFNTKKHEKVRFEGLDFYHGECTVKLTGITYPGTYYPKIEDMEKEGFEFIDN